MTEYMPNLYFRFMAFEFKIRDLFSPRKNIIANIGIKPGDSVLDYGCGPGSYVVPVSRLIGETGRIYGLDIHPLAIKYVQDLSKKKRLTNVTTIQSGNDTGLPDNCIDIVLFYDVLHGLPQLEPIFRELHRVLKPSGILSVNDHHLKEDDIKSRFMRYGLFRFKEETRHATSFSKV